MKVTNKRAIELLKELFDDQHEAIYINDDEGGDVCGAYLEKAEALEMAIKALQAERQHGEWVKTDNRWGAGKWRCTHCDNYSDVAANFCPNCGAEMIQNTCGNCYWFSKVTVPCCEQDKEPTKETEKACDRWEDGGEK